VRQVAQAICLFESRHWLQIQNMHRILETLSDFPGVMRYNSKSFRHSGNWKTATANDENGRYGDMRKE
ncbi:MAG: hypothetical protein K2O34_00360, partial [Acetatifactor sp.]|nr:hypothetical protein [Acetatifactor sp.]